MGTTRGMTSRWAPECRCEWEGCERLGAWRVDGSNYGEPDFNVCSIHHPAGRQHIAELRQRAAALEDALENLCGDVYLHGLGEVTLNQLRKTQEAALAVLNLGTQGVQTRITSVAAKSGNGNYREGGAMKVYEATPVQSVIDHSNPFDATKSTELMLHLYITPEGDWSGRIGNHDRLGDSAYSCAGESLDDLLVYLRNEWAGARRLDG